MPDSHHVALCGATHPHSRSHLRTLQLSDSIETISIYDPDEEALRTIREEIGDKVQAVHSELDHLLSESPFAAVADLPTDKNEELCEGLIRNGVHILSEKPIARTSGRLDAILNQADSKGIRVGVMYFNRYHPCTQHAKRCVEEGLLGRTTSAEARVITSQVRFRNPEHWLFDSGRSGGGILSWLGCHHLDLLNYVLDDRIAEVSAVVDTLSGEAVDVEDVASLAYRFEGGPIGSLQAGYQLATSREGYIGPNYDTYIGFRGTHGRIFWDPTSTPPRIQVESIAEAWRSAPARSLEFTLPDLEGYGGEFGLQFVDDFLEAAATGGELPADGRDALHIARVIEAAYRSSESGRRCGVNEGA